MASFHTNVEDVDGNFVWAKFTGTSFIIGRDIKTDAEGIFTLREFPKETLTSIQGQGLLISHL